MIDEVNCHLRDSGSSLAVGLLLMRVFFSLLAKSIAVLG